MKMNGKLTPREKEALSLYIRGLNERGIAEALTIAPCTAGVHLDHAFASLGSRTIDEIAQTLGCPDFEPAAGYWRELSPRKIEVLRLVGKGLSNPDIADRLGIARDTVRSHLRQAYLEFDIPRSPFYSSRRVAAAWVYTRNSHAAI